jgi:hypothetical protein
MSTCKIWQNLDIRKVTNLNIKVWVSENLDKSKKYWGPLVSLRRRLNSARSLASRTCCGCLPRTPPRASYPFARDYSGEAPSYFDSSSCHLAASTTLPSTAFLDREDLPGANPLRPTPSLVFTSTSTTAPWGTSPTSPSLPTSAPPTPHWSPTFRRAHRRHEPTLVSLPLSKTPNWVPPPLRHVSRQLLLRPHLSAGRILPVSRRCQGGEETPLLRPQVERPRGLGREGYGQVGLAHSNSSISCFSFRINSKFISI